MIGPEASAFGLARELELGVGDEQDPLEQPFEVHALLRGDLGELRCAAPVLGLEPFGCQLALDAVGVGVGKVDLVDRDDDRHAGRRAWEIDSCVCGMTPSSAATTSTAMSVTLAPRARIAVKASWPGVSRNVTLRPSTSAWYAPMCWVMPPASVSTTMPVGSRRAASSCRGRHGP